MPPGRASVEGSYSLLIGNHSQQITMQDVKVRFKCFSRTVRDFERVFADAIPYLALDTLQTVMNRRITWTFTVNMKILKLPRCNFGLIMPRQKN